MKAIRIHAHGGPEVLKLETVPDPVAGPGEVVLRVRAASVNHLDLFIRRGMPGVKVPLPRIPGADAAGEVESVGSGVTALKPGDRVTVNPGSSCGTCEFCAGGRGSLCLAYAILGEHGDGTYAEKVKVPARSVHPIPAALSFEDAAAFPLVGLTAWSMLVTKARVQPGEEVLIVGAGAGVGVMAIQIAKLCGARVIATAGTDEKLAKCKALGADVGINHAKGPFDKAVRDLTGKRGVDVVMDYVGKETWQISLRSLVRGGRLVTCGATTGFDPVEDLRQVFYRQLSIFGSTMGSAKEFGDMMRCIVAGRLKPVVDRVLPLAQASEAHRLLEARGAFGKVILRP